MPHPPAGHEYALATQLLDLARTNDTDPLLSLFAVLQVLAEDAEAKHCRSEAKVVSRGVFSQPNGYSGPGSARAYAIIAGGVLLGAQGEVGWNPVCATEAKKQGFDPFFFEGTYAVEQFAVGRFEQKPYLPDDAKEQIDQIKQALHAGLQAARLGQSTPVTAPARSRSRL